MPWGWLGAMGGWDHREAVRRPGRRSGVNRSPLRAKGKAQKAARRKSRH